MRIFLTVLSSRNRIEQEKPKIYEWKSNLSLFAALSEEGYEMRYIQEAFEQNWISPIGPNVDQFERELAVKVGSKAACALNSGTAALHLALKAAGVGTGDIVFCQSLTFFSYSKSDHLPECDPCLYRQRPPDMESGSGLIGDCFRKISAV